MSDELASDRDVQRLLDPTVLLTSCDGDAEVLVCVIAALGAQLPKELAAARACLLRGDASALREAAHRLQGMISTASPAIAAVASDLEDAAASNQLEPSAALLTRLDAMTRTLLANLAEISIDELLGAGRG